MTLLVSQAETLQAFAATVRSLLPAAGEPAMEPGLAFHPVRFSASGIGGLVGLDTETPGEVVGRRLETTARIRVRAADAAGLPGALEAITTAILDREHSELAALGILRLALESIGEPLEAGEMAEQELSFSFLFEHEIRPTEAEGVIDEIPLDTELSLSGNTPRVVRRGPFGAAALTEFEVVDDAAADLDAPSQWLYNAEEERIEQRSRVRGADSFDPNPVKPGTALVLRTGPRRPPVGDFLVRADMMSPDDDGVGLVFRFADPDNFYFFLMNSRREYRLFGKKVAGAFAPFDSAPIDTEQGFETGRLFRLKLLAAGSRFSVSLDGAEILAGEDGSLSDPGRVGLFCHGNDAAFFFNLELVQL